MKIFIEWNCRKLCWLLCLRGYDTISFSLVFNSHFHAKYLASLTKQCEILFNDAILPKMIDKWRYLNIPAFSQNYWWALISFKEINGRLSISNSKAVCRNILHCANLLAKLYISLMFYNQAWDIVTASELRKKLDFVIFDLLCSWSSRLNTSEHRSQSLGISRK